MRKKDIRHHPKIICNDRYNIKGILLACLCVETKDSVRKDENSATPEPVLPVRGSLCKLAYDTTSYI